MRKKFMCVRETKINSFKITAIIFNAYKKCKSSIQNGFEKRRTSNQNIIFSLLQRRPKNGKGTERDVESICARLTEYALKKLAKAEVNLNRL